MAIKAGVMSGVRRVRIFSMSGAKKQYRIAVIPGDGIGKEVVPEGLRVLEAAAKKHGVAVHFDHFDFASYDYYAKHGEMMPEDWKAQIGKHDAIYFGAVGWPAKIPDPISLWAPLTKSGASSTNTSICVRCG